LSAAIVAASVVALMLPMSSASADGTTVITAGPGQYTVGYSHPTGTISIGGGTISARCTAQSAKGSATLFTPRCATRTIYCPTTANSCSLIWNARESALRGPVQFGGGLLFISTGTVTITNLSPYNCPQAFSCGLRWFVTGVAPGSYVLSQVVNVASPNYPNVFDQVTLYVN